MLTKIKVIDVVLSSIAVVIGALSVVIPYLVKYKNDSSFQTIYQLLYSAFEKADLGTTAIILIIFCMPLGYLRPSRWIHIGLSTSISLLLVTFWDMFLGETSHNIWPIEIAFYILILGGPGSIGTFIGKTIFQWTHQQKLG